MKKSELIFGIVCVLMGIVFLFLAIIVKSSLGSLLFGFSFAEICIGIVAVYKYFYWNSPKNIQIYKQKIENEKIELNDELKIKLRDKAGRYAYIVSIITISLSIMVFSVLGKLKIINDAIIIVFYLFGYLVFQIVLGVIIFNCLVKKYN